MKLPELFDMGLFGDCLLTHGWVKATRHPDLPYMIYNYTPTCTWEDAWNDVTMLCRGLIVDDNQCVIARPLPKFFNVGQLTDIPWDQPYRVFDKADGSLGITYPTPEGWRVATRGSFTSDQANHANEVWKRKYEHTVWMHPDWTLLMEIVYPDNRIVLDYEGLDDLILLGAVQISTGAFVPPRLAADQFDWPGPYSDEYPTKSFDELAAEERPNKEGYVLWWPNTQFRVKVKHGEYLRLHAIVTRANTRTIWRALAEGTGMEALEGLPDEFMAWVNQKVDQFNDQYKAISWMADRAYWETKSLPTRRDQAEHLLGEDSTVWFVDDVDVTRAVVACVFKMLDGKSVADIIWKAVEPAQAEPFFAVQPDEV